MVVIVPRKLSFNADIWLKKAWESLRTFRRFRFSRPYNLPACLVESLRFNYPPTRRKAPTTVAVAQFNFGFSSSHNYLFILVIPFVHLLRNRLYVRGYNFLYCLAATEAFPGRCQ